MQILFNFFFVVLLSVILAATLRVAWFGPERMPESRWLRFCTHDWWCWAGAFFAIIAVGEFARGEASPWPIWEYELRLLSGRGNFDALITSLTILISDFWLFVIPARIYAGKVAHINMREKYLALALNLLAGAMLSGSDNPLHLLLASHWGPGDGP